MIDYQTYCAIHDHHNQRGLNAAQIAEALHLDPRTVAMWLAEPRFRPRQATARASKLDAHKPTIRRWLEAHRYSAQQVFQRLREEEGYSGGISIVKDYVRQVRPPRTAAFLTLSFAPGECAQVDWGSWDAVTVGETRRRLSLFVMVLCYSRMLYVEFTLSQTMEQFLACHQNAFAFFGNRVPEKVMVDNLKSAVLRRISGEAPVFNPRYLDFARHGGFRIVACNPGKGNEKGRVESGVGYVKKNFLNGLDISDFSALNPAARVWMDSIANVRVHGETHRRPADRFAEERSALRAGPDQPYDVANVVAVRASPSFRIRWDTNRYSVPAEYAGRLLTLKVYPDRLCVYDGQALIARHPRCWDRHQDFELPDHPKALLEQRRNAREQKLLGRFLSLSPRAEAYYTALLERRLNGAHHVQKIVALSEIYGVEAAARAMADAFDYQAFSCEYIANVLESRTRLLPEPTALQLTRRADLLELDMPAPDLSLYQAQAQTAEERP
ncbi:IS21 family transposase [Thiocapsa sp.]|uniref:IS21 family transposase n=1 Tax=Thiocapsa sp. TaxID=2024551 RepID=UPI0035934362